MSHSTTMHDHAFSSATLRRHSFAKPSAYISDEDLFGEDDAPYLSEPPAPPRPAEAHLAQPLLPPVTKPRRRSSSAYQKVKPSGKHKVAYKG